MKPAVAVFLAIFVVAMFSVRSWRLGGNARSMNEERVPDMKETPRVQMPRFAICGVQRPFERDESAGTASSASFRFTKETEMRLDSCFRTLEWPESRPVRVRETEESIVVTWPVAAELEKRQNLRRADYVLQVVIDKASGEIRSVLTGS